MMATLYDVDVRTINDHIKKIYSDFELEQSATIRKFRIVQTEGTRQVNREVNHYNLQMIISVGFKVNNERAVQFRKWANQVVKDYTIQGWVMDDERLKNSGTVLTKEYFEKQLAKIREIRLSERKFYQKITDIYATALDYDPSAKATKRFFSAVQNKELSQLERIVSAYLDLAEAQAERQIPMTMGECYNISAGRNVPKGRFSKEKTDFYTIPIIIEKRHDLNHVAYQKFNYPVLLDHSKRCFLLFTPEK